MKQVRGYLQQLKQVALVAVVLLVASTAAFATPTLQLNVVGGVYDLSTATIVSTTNNFRLYAYLVADPTHGDTTANTYYISMAVSPAVSTPSDLGSFVLNGTTVGVTSDMRYGTPPVEVNLEKDPGDLAPHSIFPTYFTEYAFTFDSSNVTQEFNTQDNPGMDPTSLTGTAMYYHGFDVDVTNLNAGSVIHFDLYNTFEVQTRVNLPHDEPGAYVPAVPEHCTNGSTSYPHCRLGTSRTNYNSAYVKATKASCTNGSNSFPNCTTTSIGFVPSGDIDIKSFAPFSHDAEGGPHDEHQVPEPLSLISIGLGLFGAEILRRRGRK